MVSVWFWRVHISLFAQQTNADVVVVLAAKAIRAVVTLGVVTALVQAIARIGLAIAGIQYATLLTVLMFICCVAQLGPC